MNDGPIEQQLAAQHPACYGWAMACCRWNRAEAEDVLHAVYVKVLEGSARFEGRSSLRTWLFAVIRRTAAESRRRQWLFDLLPARLVRADPEPEHVPAPEAALEAKEANARLRAALDALSKRQRELLYLVFYADLSVEEAAAIVGISVGSARTHYHRGKERLRALLRGDSA